MIANKPWKPPYPMVVVSPQNHDDSGWSVSELDAFITVLLKTYPINPSRIYLAGTSHGAFGVYSYLTSQTTVNRIAAAVPVAGGGSTGQAPAVSCPVWAFHGDKDGSVSPSADKAMIAAIETAHPGMDAKITIYANLGHEWNMWFYTFYRKGWETEPVSDGRTDIDPAFAPYDQDVYRWMLQFTRP